jgi:hypothetical protein
MDNPKDNGLLCSPLPAELWHKIIDLCQRSVQITHCRVSNLKDFQLISTRHVYRYNTLRSPSEVIGCCRAIVRNQFTASVVRRMAFRFRCVFGHFGPRRPCHLHTIAPLRPSSLQSVLFAPCHRIIVTALQACSKNIVDLNLGFAVDLSQCYFPLLGSFAIGAAVPFTASVSSFMQRHQSDL